MIRSSVLFFILLLFAGCNVRRYLGPGEELYNGASVEVKADSKKDRKKIRRELKRLISPEPNTKVLGARYRLWLYYKAGKDPKGKFRKWLREKAGEAPVLYDPAIPQRVSTIMRDGLHNFGYFKSEVTFDVVSRKQKARILYKVTAEKPYTIRSVSFPEGNDLLTASVREQRAATMIKPGDQYDLEKLISERERIDYELKNEGFYFFHPSYLIWKADSASTERVIDLKLALKKDLPPRAGIRYFIDKVTLVQTLRARDSSLAAGDTVMVNGVGFVTRDSTLRNSVVERHIFVRPGDRYSRRNYSQTLSRLMGMGVFRSVNAQFRDTVINGIGSLEAVINVSPTFRRSLQLEVEAVTKSNNYTGPALTISYKNRNLFRGAELFLLNFTGSFETQFTGIQKGFNSYEIGVNSQLFIPRFVTPFRIRNISSQYVPRTKFDIGVRNLNRVLYFNMNAINFSYGYTWKETSRKEHVLNPVAFSFARLINTTDIFTRMLSENPFLRSSFEEQFIIGGNYSFTYNSLTNNTNHNQFFFNGMLDLSGNLAGQLQSVIRGRRPTYDRPFTIFDDKYSQFIKAVGDFRYYSVFNSNHRLTTRLVAGAGYSYGNSLALPYIRQFFSGGSTSLRAFLPRTVGPGGYIVPDSILNRVFLDKGGDIKLEANVEYRFTIISVLKGALFVDAGNVWLWRKNPQFPDGDFYFSTFLKQLAVGTGFGFRVDVTYFVIRADIGIPLRKPYLEEGYRWVLNNLRFGDGRWRAQNLVLNIAIGYPF